MGELIDLNASLDESGVGWRVSFALDINDNGQIVGWGTNPLGRQSGFLLNPVPTLGPPPPGCEASNYRPKKCEPWRPDGLTPVPLPAALPLLLAGVGGLGFIGRRRRNRAA